jgi:hypothetical protein
MHVSSKEAPYMSSRSGSPIATLFMFVPLVAVPLMAVFGVPKFPALSASPTGEADDDFFAESDWQHDDPISPATDDRFGPPDAHGHVEPPPFSHDNSPVSAGDHSGQIAREDPFAPQTSAAQPTATWDPPNGALSGWALEDEGTSQTAAAAVDDPQARESAFAESTDSTDRGESRDYGDVREAAGSSAEGETLTWQSAVRRLQEFGIEDFQLRPGSAPDQFHFSCLIEPKDNPRVMHRFEAEAAEPLDAVQDVVTQLESWLDKQ